MRREVTQIDDDSNDDGNDGNDGNDSNYSNDGNDGNVSNDDNDGNDDDVARYEREQRLYQDKVSFVPMVQALEFVHALQLNVRVPGRTVPHPMWINSISSGSPHVRPTGVHRKCGEPVETKKNTHPKYITVFFFLVGRATRSGRSGAGAGRAPQR